MKLRTGIFRMVIARAVERRRFGDFPVGEMIRRGWLRVPDESDPRAVARALCAFFDVPDLSALRSLKELFETDRQAFTLRFLAKSTRF